MIHSLKLENFRKHKALSVDFTAGMNGIFGPNYTGKSTILYGILYALGGIKAVPCKSVVKSGCNTFTVEMEFSIDGDRYRLLRTKTTDRLFKGEDQVANGASVVNKEVEKLLGMSIKRFTQIRYSRQKFTSALLTLGATELHNILSDVSGADFIQKVLERLSDLRKRTDGQLEGRELVDTSGLQVKYVADELALMIASEDKVKVENEYAALANKATGLKNLKLETEKVESTNRDSTFQRGVLAATVDELKQELVLLERERANSWGETSPSEDVFDASRKELKALKTTLDKVVEHEREGHKLSDQLDNASEAVDIAYGALGDASDALEANPGPTQEMIDRLADATSKVAEFDTAMGEKLVEVGNLKKALDPDNRICPTCHRELEDVECLEDLAAKLAKAESEMQKLHEKSRSATAELTKASATCKAASTAFNKAATQKEALQVTYDRAKAHLAKVEVQLAAWWASKAELPDEALIRAAVESGQLRCDHLAAQLRDYEEFTRRVSKVERTLMVSMENLEALPALVPVGRSSDDIGAELETVEASMVDARDALSAAMARISDLRVSLRETTLLLDRGKADNELVSRLTSRLAAIKALHKFLSGSKDDYMREVWASLMADASQLVTQATAGALSGMERTEDGQFSYREGEHCYTVSEASGAQQAIMGLAVQTALAKVLPPVFDVLLVDEPSADMDDEHSMTLSMLLPARAAQVICVSHARMDSSTCANVIDLGA